jgi:ABC-type transport system involved in multi-copper enzyme maturation permease subunit
MTVRGVLLVAGQEFRVRLRTRRLQWLLGGWVILLATLTSTLYIGLSGGGFGVIGVPMFGLLMLFVLALALLVSPAVTAQSINGERERGTLATLQVTQLTAAEIAVGKLIAGWGFALCALTTTLPFVAWALAEGGVGMYRAVVVFAVVGLLMGVVCAIALAYSALLTRSVISTLSAYATVFLLTVGSTAAFALADLVAGASESTTRWLIAPNPIVILADAAPEPPPTGEDPPSDPLRDIRTSVRSIGSASGEPGPLWPYGLAFDMMLGAGALWITTRALRTSTRDPAPSTRVA